MIDKYVKQIDFDVKFKVNRKSIEDVRKMLEESSINLIDNNALQDTFKDINKEFDNLSIVKNGLVSDKDLDKLRLNFNTYKETLFKIEEISKEIEEVSMFSRDKETLKYLKAELSKLQNVKDEFEGVKTSNIAQVGSIIGTGIKSTLASLFSSFVDSIKTVFSDAISELKTIASYDITSSSFFNKDAVSMYAGYGLTGSSAYGMSKALKSQHFSSIDEFLENLPFMNEEQLNYMREIAEISKESYEEDAALSKELQEFTKEYDLFKREIQKSALEFLAKNKDTIKTFMEVSMKALQGILDVLSGIFSIFSDAKTRSTSERQQAVADILGVSTSVFNNSNKTTNISIDNTFNGVGKQDQSWLSNSGQMTYQQIIAALK